MSHDPIFDMPADPGMSSDEVHTVIALFPMGTDSTYDRARIAGPIVSAALAPDTLGLGGTPQGIEVSDDDWNASGAADILGPGVRDIEGSFVAVRFAVAVDMVASFVESAARAVSDYSAVTGIGEPGLVGALDAAPGHGGTATWRVASPDDSFLPEEWDAEDAERTLRARYGDAVDGPAVFYRGDDEDPMTAMMRSLGLL